MTQFFYPKISQIIKNKAKDLQREIYIHSDAVQAAGKLDLDTKKLGIDLMSLSGHKVRGPKGVGCLYLKRGIPISPMIVGGGQERQRRSGTENVPGIVGFSKALALANEEKNKFNTHCRKLTDLLKLRLQNLEYEHIIVTPNEDSLSNILNTCSLYVEQLLVISSLDNAGLKHSFQKDPL